MNISRFNRDTGKAAEEFFEKTTGLKPMPNRWPGYDFKGTPFMGFDGRPIQVKGSEFHRYERHLEAGQWHWTRLNDKADISALVGFHEKRGPQCFILTRNFVSHLRNPNDIHCGISRFGFLSHAGQSGSIARYRVPPRSLEEFIDKLCAWMHETKYWETGKRQSRKSIEELFKLYKQARTTVNIDKSGTQGMI